MVIFGYLDEIEKQLTALKRFPEVARYLRNFSKSNLNSIETGKEIKNVIDGTHIFGLDQAPMTEPREKRVYEAHKNYIDVQFVAEGEELIEVTDLEGLAVTTPYTHDYELYSNAKKGSIIHMKPGMVAIFFPEDAHMPKIAVGKPERIVKTVVKYSVELI